MKNMVLLAAGVSLLAGCATKEMKSTPFYEGGEVTYVGEASDRVNLWPVAYWRNPVGAAAWPLVSFSDDHFALRPHWVFPLWYKGEKAFISPLYAQGEDSNKSWWAVPALLSWGGGWSDKKSRKNDGTILLGLGSWYCGMDVGHEYGNWLAFPFVQREWATWFDDPKREPTTETQVACYFVGWKTCGDKLKSLYAFPLFSWDDDGSWLTPLGGQLNCNGTTNTVITPLVGVTSGQQTGGWVFPIWSHEKDADFAEKVALIDSPTLPACVKVSVVTNTYKKGSEYGKTRLHGKMLCGHDSTVFLLHDVVHSVEGSDYRPKFGASTNRYEISEYSKRGHNLLFNYRSERSVIFDLKTKSKLSDEEESGASLLVWLYDYKWNHDRSSGDEYTRHRVLWQLWGWEEEKGEVSLDVFPSFTYDARKDGYTKTSLLWRLFRYERDPNAGTSIDFLFLPIWR